MLNQFAPITGISSPEYIAEYVKKLAWFKENPVKITVTEWNPPDKKKVSDFYNRLTIGSHL